MRRPGISTDKAWLAGWDAGITGQIGNPYKRRDYARQFERGREAGRRSSNEDVRVMKLRVSRASNRAGSVRASLKIVIAAQWGQVRAFPAVTD